MNNIILKYLLHDYGPHESETQILCTIMVCTKVKLKFYAILIHDYDPHESETPILRESNARLWSARK